MDLVLILLRAVLAFIVVNAALVVVAYVIYGERKVGAHMQARQGPNRAGPIGLLQSFADLLKMLKKEDTTPKDADKVVFFIAPIVATFASVAVLAIIPWSPGRIDIFGVQVPMYVADVGVGMLVALALSSLGVYGVLMAGWSSNSKYSLLSGMRASSQVISYELTFGISLIGVFLMAGSLSLVGITNSQTASHDPLQPGIWHVLLQPVALLIFFCSALAEAARTPFDLVEAESELVSGYHTEYSGMRFGLFQLAEFNAVFTMSALTSVLFMGGWGSPLSAWFDSGRDLAGIPVLSGLLGSGIHWLLIKVFLFIFVFYWLRWTLPRFRYDQLMGLCWKVFLPTILANILVLSVLKLIFFPPPPPGVPLAQQAATYNQLYWWVIAAIELVLGALTIYGFSRLAGVSWFGKAERPVLMDRQIILVRNAQGGRGTIEGEARPVGASRGNQ
ncbi:MAG: NADH-quinone oxidoreductase subunit NuoH [Chloroflexia bacterium]